MEEERKNVKSSHFLLMVLCCAIPLAGILVLSYLDILGSWGVYALILLCPLLHFLFMRKMMTKETRGGSESRPMLGEDRRLIGKGEGAEK